MRIRRSFYCNRNDKDGGSQKYPRLTLETLIAGIGSTKGTVPKIFNERKNGKTRYPVLETEDDVLAIWPQPFPATIEEELKRPDGLAGNKT